MQLSVTQLKELISNSYVDRRGRNMYGTCPKCGQNEFGISLDNNHQFGCFRKNKCGFAGNIFTLLDFLGKRIYEVAPSVTIRQHIDIEKILDQKESNPIDLFLNNVNLPAGWKRISDHPYLNNRGFNSLDYEKYKPGITSIESKFKDFIVFPIYQYGNIKAFVARNTKSKDEINQLNDKYKAKGIKKTIKRYLNSETDFAKLLLGVDELVPNTDTVILVEGLFDKHNVDKQLKLDQQDEIKCCATFKCAISDEQIFLLQQHGIVNIIMLYDPDVISSIIKAAWILDNYFKVLVCFNDAGQDPGDMTSEQFEQVFDSAKTPSQFSVSKIQVPILQKT